MLSEDEEALTCDFAETYHILDMRSLPVKLWATLASGLRADSRIKQKISGLPAPLIDVSLFAIIDRLSMLLWINSKDGQKNRNRPESLLDSLLNAEKKANEEIQTFGSGEEFEKARKKIIERGDG